MREAGSRKVGVQELGLGARVSRVGGRPQNSWNNSRGSGQKVGLSPGSQTCSVVEKQEVRHTSRKGMNGLKG